LQLERSGETPNPVPFPKKKKRFVLQRATKGPKTSKSLSLVEASEAGAGGAAALLHPKVREPTPGVRNFVAVNERKMLVTAKPTPANGSLKHKRKLFVKAKATPAGAVDAHLLDTSDINGQSSSIRWIPIQTFSLALGPTPSLLNAVHWCETHCGSLGNATVVNYNHGHLWEVRCVCLFYRFFLMQISNM
jgi:hypothetical protein